MATEIHDNVAASATKVMPMRVSQVHGGEFAESEVLKVMKRLTLFPFEPSFIKGRITCSLKFRS